MARDRMPPQDAEKCDAKSLMDNFCLPPGLSENIGRSMLLIGTRGSGKTYYLRWCRHKQEDVAIIGDLKYILNPISQDTGGAGLAFELIPPSQEPLIRAKTIALLSAWLAKEALNRQIELPLNVLKSVLGADLQYTEDIFSQIAKKDLDDFSPSANIGSFVEFVSELAVECEKSKGQLLILLDRAEDVPYPCLTPIFTLLDQSHPFFAIVAARPGIFGCQQHLAHLSITPGDHYDIWHLGASPYTEEWRNFAQKVLKTWVPNAIKECPKETLDLILNLSRDSLRNAMKLLYNSIEEVSGVYSSDKFDEHVKVLQNTLLRASQGALHHINPDLEKFIHQLRRKIGPFILPVLLQLYKEGQGKFGFLTSLGELSKDDRVVGLGLRAGFFTTKDGEHWNPFSSISEVEIPPIFLWRKNDQWYDIPPIK